MVTTLVKMLKAVKELPRKNSLMLHGKGCTFGVLRLALGRYAPSAGAQEDRFLIRC